MKDTETNEQQNIDICKRLQEREQYEWIAAQRILAPSQYVKDELIRSGADVNKIKLVPFGYDSPYTLAERKEVFEKRYDNNRSIITVLFAGNAGYRKGINEFLSITNQFKGAPVKFVIAGQIESSVQNEIDKLNIKNLLLLGKLPLNDLLNEYRKADIFFFPSYLEGSARVIFEAMSWGLPILTTNQTGSIIKHGQEGYLVNAGEITRMHFFP